MAYDRYENRGGWREDNRRGRDQRDERGFFERARDEVSSWFGEEEGDQHNQDERSQRDQSRDRHGRDQDRSAMFGGGQSSSYGRGREGGDYRNQYGRGGGESGGFGGGDYTQQNRSPWQGHRDDERSRGYPGSYGQSGGGSFSSRQGHGGHDDDRWERSRSEQGRAGGAGFGRSHEDDYRPMAGDYGRSGGRDQHRSGMGSQNFSREQYGRQDFSQDQDRDRSYNYGGWGDRDSQRQDSGSSRSGGMMMGGGAMMGGGRHDDHYAQWRQRQIDELDRDYHDYRSEHQSKFENEFSGWRQQRQTKRQMLQSIREHSEVVDMNGEHVGTVDKVRGDKVILTKSDPEAGGVHRSFNCSLLDRVEDGRVYLTGTMDSIRGQLQEEHEDSREQRGGGGFMGALFGKDDNREQPRSEDSRTEGGPHVLDRSFSGTYEDDSRKS